MSAWPPASGSAPSSEPVMERGEGSRPLPPLPLFSQSHTDDFAVVRARVAITIRDALDPPRQVRSSTLYLWAQAVEDECGLDEVVTQLRSLAEGSPGE